MAETIEIFEMKGTDGEDDYFYVLSIKVEGFFYDVYALHGIPEYKWSIEYHKMFIQKKIGSINIPEEEFEHQYRLLSNYAMEEEFRLKIINHIKKTNPHYFI